MAPIWAFLVVIFAIPGIGQSVKSPCPNNKTYRCVQAPNCTQHIGIIHDLKCPSTTEVCCQEKRVNTVVRTTGQPGKQLCPSDKIHRCVSASSCPQNVGTITAYKCSSTTEVCCQEKRVNTVARITGQPVKQLCPNNKINQCVPAPYCPRDVGSIATYRCSSTTEVCCEEKRILFGQRYIGAGKYVPGPYSQDL